MNVRKTAGVVTILLLGAWAGYLYLNPGLREAKIPTKVVFDAKKESQLLRQIRKSCDVRDISDFIAKQRQSVARYPTDPEHLRLLAEALLERCATRIINKGFAPGTMLFDGETPKDILSDIEEALGLVSKARELGDETSENWRIEASLLPYKIVSLPSAIMLARPITQALDKALELGKDNPHIHFALGCRKLLAPRYLGQDLEKAIEHLEFAAAGLPLDERPLIYAALATLLLGDRPRSTELLELAAKRTPANDFPAEVIQRLKAGENDPFARDVIPRH